MFNNFLVDPLEGGKQANIEVRVSMNKCFEERKMKGLGVVRGETLLSRKKGCARLVCS